MPLASVVEILVLITPTLLTAVGCGVFLAAMHWLFIARQPGMEKERLLPRQLLMLGFTLVAVVVVILTLPVSDGNRKQVLTLLGLLISALVAFSSATIVANLMAGLMLRVTKPFRAGDFIQINDHFGRVSERGLLDTEIQTEHRDLIALPHTYLITNPVKTIRASGTIVSSSLSLGYDEHHHKVEGLLQTAAGSIGLEDPFVIISELGDSAITYRVAGLLTEVKSLITTRSNLNRAILDTLHEADVEIASPSIVNQRRIAEGHVFLPSTATPPAESSVTPTAENIAFDKADEAEAIERTQTSLAVEIAELEAALAAAQDDKAKAQLAAKLEEHKQRAAALAKVTPGAEA